MWKAAAAGEKVEDRPAYANLINDGVLDHCGMTLLAGKAVGASFVGAVAATLALSEILRLLHGGPVHRLIRSEEHTSELQSLMRISYAVFSLKTKNKTMTTLRDHIHSVSMHWHEHRVEVQ